MVAAGTLQVSVTLVAPAAKVPQTRSPVAKVPALSKSIQPQTAPAFEAPETGTVTL